MRWRALSLTIPTRQAGAISALFGTIHYGSGILGSALVSLLADRTPWPMGLVVGIAGLGGLLCARLLDPVAATKALSVQSPTSDTRRSNRKDNDYV